MCCVERSILTCVAPVLGCSSAGAAIVGYGVGRRLNADGTVEIFGDILRCRDGCPAAAGDRQRLCRFKPKTALPNADALLTCVSELKSTIHHTNNQLGIIRVLITES